MLRFFSPAKINLFLRVVSKRPDGYHELASLFQAIDLGDHLTFEPHACDVLTCNDPALPTDASNLVLQATQLFRRKSGLNLFLKVHLDKRIPCQAGLGGGSGNAATTLWACNEWAGRPFSTEKLKEWGAEIGSDIPFFFSEGTAYCTGRGEQVQALPALPTSQLWIVKPSEGLPTPEVYRRLRLPTLSGVESPSKLDLEAFFSGSLNYFNDLEEPAFAMRPELKNLKMTLLHSGFKTVLMCGSGSSLFCLGEGKLPTDTHLHLFSARFINRPPSKWYSSPLK